jgi:Xaa-Pro aminopeptidase
MFQPTPTMTASAASAIPTRLSLLRGVLRQHQLAALVIPSSDPHLSEYLPERWQGRQWLSGFTGSSATLVVTLDAAALFTDNRYWEQAERELTSSTIVLERIPAGRHSTHLDWMLNKLPAGSRVSVDGGVLSLAAAQRLREGLNASQIELETGRDVLGEVWSDRPAPPAAPIEEHTLPHASESRASKLLRLRHSMAEATAQWHVISTLDDIAWLLNLRGSDIPFNPVFLSHMVVSADKAMLFVAQNKLPQSVQTSLAADGITLVPYESINAALQAFLPQSSVLIDPRRITLGLREQIKPEVRVIEAINPTTLFKSCKSAQDANHIRAAMEQDGAAMCEFYAWFEAALAMGQECITELTVDERLSAERARRPGFKGLSFTTIAGFNANGAMPHYRATPESHAVIEGNGLLLIDSGAQYLGATTDITRMWAIGQTTPEQRRDVTLVLKGMLALSHARFPQGTLSPMLDAIARAPLWQHAIDFGHGTGHGVGYFLNVHEGPQSISKAIPEPHMAMRKGMVTSVEPGVYRPGKWGVRIENLVLNVPSKVHDESEVFDEFLEFETLTLCPIDTRCLDISLLRPDEIETLNAYQAKVRQRLQPHVSGAALDWLQLRTQAVSAQTQ